MKKIITAIDNPKLNEELKKEKNFEIVGKDIQYKEAILEILEKEKIDLLIISEKIIREGDLNELLDKIKMINENIKIIFILEKENHDLDKILIEKKITDIYYNNKINLEELIKIINKKEINIEEEFLKLKKIVEEKNITYEKEEEKIFERKNLNIGQIKKGIKLKIKTVISILKKNKNKKNMSTKIITFNGNYKSGKTTLSLIIGRCLAIKKYKILLVDGDFEKLDLSVVLKKNKEKKIKSKNKIQIKKEMNYKKQKLKNLRNSIYKYKIKNIIKKYQNKLDKNLYFFYGLNIILSNNKYYNQMDEFLQKYDYIIIDLSKNNLDSINKKILKSSYMNFIVMEANLLGINEVSKLIEKYSKDWEINKETIVAISNKKNIISIDRELIRNTFLLKNKILEIKENKFYQYYIHQIFKMKIPLKKNEEINKIIYKIIE